MKIYGLVYDSGDGSSSIHWFKNKKLVAHLLDSNNEIESYRCNDGNIASTIILPKDVEPEKCGIYFLDKEYDKNFNLIE